MDKLETFLHAVKEFIILAWNWSMDLPDAGCVVFIIVALLLVMRMRSTLARTCICIPAIILVFQHVVPLVLHK